MIIISCCKTSRDKTSDNKWSKLPLQSYCTGNKSLWIFLRTESRLNYFLIARVRFVNDFYRQLISSSINIVVNIVDIWWAWDILFKTSFWPNIRLKVVWKWWEQVFGVKSQKLALPLKICQKYVGDFCTFQIVNMISFFVINL